MNIAATPSAQRTTTGRLLGGSYKNSQSRWEHRNRPANPSKAKKFKPTKRSVDPLVDRLIAGYEVMRNAASAMPMTSVTPMAQIAMPQPAVVSKPSGAPVGSGADYSGKIPGSKVNQAIAKAVLDGIGAPTTPSNMAFMLAWMQAEGGPTHNPLGTKMPGYGGRVATSSGVMDYPSPTAGANAIIATLKGHPGYKGILTGLQHSINPLKLARDPGFGVWVTGQPNKIGKGQYIYAVLASNQGGKNGSGR